MNQRNWLIRISMVWALVPIFASHTLAVEPESIYCETPEPDSIWSPGVNVHGMVMAGDIAYIGVHEQDVRIVDYTDPANPQVAGTLPGSIEAGVYLKDDATIVTSSSQFGTRVFDITDRTNPVEIEAFDYVGQILAFRDDVMYIRGTEELLAYRCIGDDAGELIGTLALNGDPRYAVVKQDIGFINCVPYLCTIDFSNPDAPVVLADKLILPGGTVFMEQSGDLLITGRSSLSIYDVSDPIVPVVLFTDKNGFDPQNAVVKGDSLYVADRSYGLHVYDIAEPTNPVLVGLGRAPQITVDISVGLNTVLIITPSGISAFDRNEISSPIIDSQRDFTEMDTSTEFEGILYATGRFDGIISYDMRDPDRITQLTHIQPPGRVWDILAEDDYLYALSESGLHVYDASDPMAPVHIGAYSLLDYSHFRAKIGEYLFVLREVNHNNYEYELVVLSVEDPTRPRRVSSYYLDDFMQSMTHLGSTLYLTQSLAGVEVVDFQNPFSPTLVGSFPERLVKSVAVVDNNLVVASDSLKVFDLEDPFNPAFRSEINQSGFVNIFEVQESKIYASYPTGTFSDTGVAIFDLSSPDNPVEEVRYPLFDQIRGVHVINEHLGVTFYKQGVALIRSDESCTPCGADLNGDGWLDFVDVSAFLIAYNNKDPLVDFTGDGNIDFLDMSEFLRLYQTGCL